MLAVAPQSLVRGYKPAHSLVCLDVGAQFGQVQAASLPLKGAD